MKRKAVRLFLPACLGAWTLGGTAHAARPGTTGAETLRFAASPRSFAMAEAMTAVPDGPLSLFANPAALSSMQYQEFDLAYNRGIEDISHQSIFYGRPARFGAVGLGVLRRDSGGLPGYDASGLAVEQVSAEDWVLGAGLGKQILESGPWALSLGAGAKAMDSRLEKARGGGYAADLGALADLNLSWAKLSAGLAAQNLGPGIKYDRETTPLPAAYRLGLAASRRIYGDSFTLSLDAARSRADPGRLRIAVGFEGGVSGALFPRIGFRTPDDLGNGLFFGLGLKVKSVRLDYGLALLGAFGPAHRFGLSFKWGEPIDISRTEENLRLSASHRDLGRQFMRRQRYLDAVHEFSQALNYDPTNRDLLYELKSAYDAMR